MHIHTQIKLHLKDPWLALEAIKKITILCDFSLTSNSNKQQTISYSNKKNAVLNSLH